MTTDLTRAERDRMNELQGELGALQTVMRINHDSHTAQQLNELYGERQKEYEALATRAREATKERMARVRAGKAKPSDFEGGEANG
jgi:uncharacterized protein YbjQ (UPF0145 family)